MKSTISEIDPCISPVFSGEDGRGNWTIDPETDLSQIYRHG